MSASYWYWAEAPYALAKQPVHIRLDVHRSLIGIGAATDLRDAVKKYTARLEYVRANSARNLRVALADRARRKERRRWNLIRATVPAGPCAYCGEPDARTVDHVISRARGGGHHASNLVRACLRCNASKGAMTPHEWLASGRPGAARANSYLNQSPETEAKAA